MSKSQPIGSKDLRLGFEAWRVILRVLRDTQANPADRKRVESFIAEHEAITARIGYQPREGTIAAMTDLGERVNAFINARDVSAHPSAYQASANQCGDRLPREVRADDSL